MYEKMLEIKQNKKWLFYLLIVPFALLFLYNLYNKYIIRGAKKDIEDAEKQEGRLKNKQIKLLEQAQKEQDEARKIEEKINNTTIDKDWHLK